MMKTEFMKKVATFPKIIETEQDRADVRVVVPAYHAENTLQVCIEAIINSTDVGNLEVVIADNGGNEKYDSLPMKSFPVRHLSCQEQASAAYARNCGAVDFKDGVLVFIDADVDLEKDAITNLIQPILKGDADATVGNYTSNNFEGLNFFQQYKQLYISRVYERSDGFIKNDFWTAICAIRADVFQEMGQFDSSYKGSGGEDTEFGIRLSQQNWRILSVPAARGKHIHYFDAIKLIKNDFNKGIRTMTIYLEKGQSFSNHRHAKNGDILAVFLAVNLAITTFIIFFSSFNHPLISLLWCIIILGYFVVRRELLAVFLKRSVAFLAQAIPLMYILDLVRSLSVIMAICIFLSSRYKNLLKN